MDPYYLSQAQPRWSSCRRSAADGRSDTRSGRPSVSTFGPQGGDQPPGPGTTGNGVSGCRSATVTHCAVLNLTWQGPTAAQNLTWRI